MLIFQFRINNKLTIEIVHSESIFGCIKWPKIDFYYKKTASTICNTFEWTKFVQPKETLSNFLAENPDIGGLSDWVQIGKEIWISGRRNTYSS